MVFLICVWTLFYQILMTALQIRFYDCQLPNKEIEMENLGNLLKGTQLSSNKHLRFKFRSDLFQSVVL